MAGTTIPPAARTTVRQRARHRCERCGAVAPNGQWHHRRSRRVIDAHRHCPCNGVWLCANGRDGCHEQVHRWLEKDSHAKAGGFLLSQWVTQPHQTPVLTPWGLRFHYCDGTFATTT